MKNFFKNLWKKIFKTKEPSAPVPTPKPTPKPIPVEPAPAPIPTPTKPGVIADFKFVDSSHHHPEFDPKKYTAPFLSNKCTQGTTFVDRTHAPRKKLCAENNIKYSGYHFYECRRDPIEQANFYIKTHGEFTCPPQVDFETEERYLKQDETSLFLAKEDLYTCLLHLEAVTGKTPWLYVNYGAAGRLKFDKKFGRFLVWFARYNTTLGPIPAPWTAETTAAWQYTESEKFPGFQGGNDVNIYYGKVNALGL